MSMKKVSKDVMVLEDPPASRMLAMFGFIVVFAVAVMMIRGMGDSWWILLAVLVPVGLGVLLIYSKMKITLDKSAGKMIIERSSIFGSKTESLPLGNIARVKSVYVSGRGSHYYADFLGRDGKSIVKKDLYPEETESVSSFLGVPFDKPKSFWDSMKKMAET